MSTQKDDLRAQLKLARLELSDYEYVLRSRAIVSRLRTLIDWSVVHSLHYYEPIKSLLEPDIGDHIRYLEDNYANMTLSTPRLINNEWRMIMAKGAGLPDSYDVVLVPTLGFDTSLNRLGYGGGYYDQFLAVHTNAKAIGVSFEMGKISKIDKEPHDIPMSMVVTESNVYRP